jgi:hypothetical protein
MNIEKKRSEYLQRHAWIEAVLAVWDSVKYRTLGEFMASPEGQEFQRRTQPGRVQSLDENGKWVEKDTRRNAANTDV